jgi:hypothetical protein
MTDQQRPTPIAPATPSPAGQAAGSWPAAVPGGPPPALTPAPPAPRRRGGMILFGCLGAFLLVLLLGGAGAGVLAYKVRNAAAQAQHTLATSVAPVVSSTTVASDPRPTVAGTTVAASGGASAAPTSRPAAAQPAELNQPVTIPNWTVTVLRVERPGRDLIWAADNDPATATGTWVVVVLTVTRTANDAEGVGYDDVALRSGQVFTYAIPEEFWTLDAFYPAFKHSQPLFKVVPRRDRDLLPAVRCGRRSDGLAVHLRARDRDPGNDRRRQRWPLTMRAEAFSGSGMPGSPRCYSHHQHVMRPVGATGWREGGRNWTGYSTSPPA